MTHPTTGSLPGVGADEARRLAENEARSQQAQHEASALEAVDAAGTLVDIAPGAGRVAADLAQRGYERVAYPTGYRSGGDGVMSGSVRGQSYATQDMGTDAATAAGEAVDNVAGSTTSAAKIGEAVANVAEASSGLGDVAEAAGGLIEGIGDLFSGLG